MKLTKPAAAFLAAATAALALPAAGQSTARLSYHWAPTHESAIMSSKLAEQVARRTGGKLKIDVFPSGQLYTIRQIIGALSAGSVELGGVVTHNQIAALERDWNVFQLPYTWESIEQQRKFLAESPEGKAMRQRVLQKTGMAHVAYVPVGPYALFSAKDSLGSVAAMKGLKARALAASERPGLAARGMSVVSLSTEEIYPALQNGMIDTLATVPTAIKAYAWWDHLKNAQLPYSVYADSEVMANARWLASLPADPREVLLSVGREISREATEQTYKGNLDALNELAEKHGGKIVTLQGKLLEEMKALDREKTEPELAKLMSPEIYAAAKRFTGRK
jgi:TRAP-type C4-dicarboxylate transport system substrate-binding protein